MKKILLTTCFNELSLPFFTVSDITKQIELYFLNYSEDPEYIKSYMKTNNFDYIYIRDPFLDSMPIEEIRAKLHLILDLKKDAYMIDNIKEVEHVFFEDKWNQYQVFKDLMPETTLLETNTKIDFDKFFVKKRISSRAKGVVFSEEEITDTFDSYIIQPSLKIEKEYRIFILFGEVINTAEIKSSKSAKNLVKVIGAEPINEDLASIAKITYERTTFDFIGIDVAKTSEGMYKLIEVNRSCQFGGFLKETGINLAHKFINKLLVNF